MPVGINTVSLGSGLGSIYLDESGGFIQFSLTSNGYTSVHKVRVLPFGGSSAGAYNAPASGQETTLTQTADNLMALLAPLFDSTASGIAYATYQVQSGNEAVAPYGYSYGGSSLFTAGTASGGGLPYFVSATVAGKSAAGARWALRLPGPASSVASQFGRFGRASVGSPIQALMDYLDGTTNGGVHALKTAIVAHDGEALDAPLFWLLSTNKRLRRRARVA